MIRASGISPHCNLQLLVALIRFISFCTNPDVAAKNAVKDPTKTITISDNGLYSNNHDDLNNKYIPAVTSVAACSNAETGVG